MKSDVAISSRGKAGQVRKRITALAMSATPGSKLPTVRELCQTMGVATNTLVTVLDELERRRVIIRRHGSGLYVSPRIHQKNIGLVFGANVFAADVSPVYGMLFNIAQRRAQQLNESFGFYIDVPASGEDAPPAHQDLIDAVESGKLQGVLRTTSGNDAQQRWWAAHPIPMVSFLPTMRDPGVVGFDYGCLVELGAGALHARGCRRLALLSALGFSRGQNFDEDLRAFEQSRLRLGFAVNDPSWVWQRPVGGELRKTREQTGLLWEDLGRQAVHDLFGPNRLSRQVPDGLVVTDDMMCRGALQALSQLGLTVGRDVFVATHTNRGSNALREELPSLIRVEVDPEHIVAAMFEILEPLMAGQKPPRESIVVKPYLVEEL